MKRITDALQSHDNEIALLTAMPKELTPVADSYVEMMLTHGIMFRSRFA
jgi:hypothetical protein